jgi:hypothetical protein
VKGLVKTFAMKGQDKGAPQTWLLRNQIRIGCREDLRNQERDMHSQQLRYLQDGQWKREGNSDFAALETRTFEVLESWARDTPPAIKPLTVRERAGAGGLPLEMAVRHSCQAVKTLGS